MEEENDGQNRLFVTLAIALIGLLVLGLLGIGSVFIIRQNLEEQTIASQPTPTLLLKLPNPTPTFTPVSPKPTNTPLPTPTSTPVLGPGGVAANSGGAAASSGENNNGSNGSSGQDSPTTQASPTRTPAPKAEAASRTVVPETGFGGLEAVLIAAGLVIVLFVARRLRMSA